VLIYRERCTSGDAAQGIATSSSPSSATGDGEVHLTFLGKYTRFENLATATTATVPERGRAGAIA